MGREQDLSDQTILITGASSGLGAHFARLCAGHGAKLVLAARRKDKLDAIVEELAASGAEVVAVACDVEDESQIIATFNAAESALGPINVVINNAGMNLEGLAVELASDDFDKVMRVNVRGVFLVAREAAKRMIARGPEIAKQGRIVNIASIGAHTVLPGLAAYCASKAAVVQMTKALAREWARVGISVNAVCPGYIETEINADWFGTEGGQRQIKSFPRRRLMSATDLDATMLMLASPGAGAITGSIFTLDDGQSL